MIIAYIFFFYDPPHIDAGAVEKKNSVFYGICEEFSVVNSKKIIIKNVTDEYGNYICDKAIVYADTRSENNVFDTKIHIGNTLKLIGKSECFAKPGNPGQFNEYEYYLSLGIDVKIFASQMSIASDETDTTESDTSSVDNDVEEDIISTEDTTVSDDMTHLGNFRITGYVATGNKTASGTWPSAGRTIAMNNGQRKELGLSYGDQIYIDGLGTYTLEDSGCAYGRIDIFCNSVSECYALPSYLDAYLAN